jgi:hypothetical protein
MPLYMLQKDITSHIFSIICICGAAQWQLEAPGNQSSERKEGAEIK